MSILAKVSKQEHVAAATSYALIVGRSSSGKTTVAGSVPGKTLLLQIRDREFGCESAIALARSLGNEVIPYSISTIQELLDIAIELRTDKDYDNVYVDGWSAITFMLAESPDIAPMIEGRKGGNSFVGYARIQTDVAKIQKAYAELTYPDIIKPKSVFFTLAIDVKTDANGVATDIVPVMKGKASYQEFTRPSPTIVTLAVQHSEEGERRIMLTKNHGPYLARINGILDKDNVGIMEPDLSLIMNTLTK